MNIDTESASIATGAAILAGGLSRRMGANKALLRLEPDGPTLIEVVVARLKEAGFGDGLMLVANTSDDLGFLGLTTVADELPGAGPLGGILTALVHSHHPRVLVVACDMPLLNPALLRYMAQLPDSSDVIIPRWIDKSGSVKVEPLHAIYSRRCIKAVRERLSAGNLKVQGLLDDISAQYVEEQEMRRFDPQLLCLRNINTPQDADIYSEL